MERELCDDAQRNIAALYEYWCFLKIVKIVGGVCGAEFDNRALISAGDRLQVNLKRGMALTLSGQTERLGRRIEISLWFNRTFSSREGRDESWSRSMRPDMSLRVGIDGWKEEKNAVWLHFDAKYQVEGMSSPLGPNPRDEESEGRLLDGERFGRVNRTSLLKMHAYKDGIRGSVGVYVLYPGSETEHLPAYREILPGLGAFVLRPSAYGAAAGTNEVREFIEASIRHLASQHTQDARVRYWTGRALAQPAGGKVTALRKAEFLTAPPADTLVMLAQLRSVGEFEWIQRARRYAIPIERDGGPLGLDLREVSADLLLLYGIGAETTLWTLAGNPELATKSTLLGMGHPEQAGEFFFLLALGGEALTTSFPRVSSESVRRIAEAIFRRSASRGAVASLVVTTWEDFVSRVLDADTGA